jgi:hypothetical protein
MTKPLPVIAEGWLMIYTDLESGTRLANLVTATVKPYSGS